jgi:hypothetical protein
MSGLFQAAMVLLSDVVWAALFWLISMIGAKENPAD